MKSITTPPMIYDLSNHAGHPGEYIFLVVANGTFKDRGMQTVAFIQVIVETREAHAVHYDRTMRSIDYGFVQWAIEKQRYVPIASQAAWAKLPSARRRAQPLAEPAT